MPLSHPPGHAQCDCGEALVIIGGVEQKAHCFVLDLPHSDGCFVKAYPAETTEAFLDGHVSAFASWAERPRASCTTTPSWRWPGSWGMDGGSAPGPSRNSSPTTCSMTGRPSRQGNDKGKVEGMTGYMRRNFLVPAPSFESFETLNAHLERRCLARMDARLRGHSESIGQRMERDLEALLPLPPVAYDACEKQAGRVSSLSLVRYRTNDYSAPVAYGHRDVLVKGYVDRVVISCGSEVIAAITAPTSGMILCSTPSTTCPCSSRRRRPWTRPLPCGDGTFPRSLARCAGCWSPGWDEGASGSFVQVLRLFEHFFAWGGPRRGSGCPPVGALSFDAVKHLVLCRLEGRPPRLDLELYPYLPRVRVSITSAGDYMTLLSGRAA